MTSFRFKKFAVEQGGAAMKVGTDGVLLGAWCDLAHKPLRALDIGTGTGLIALMVAQRSEAWGCRVDAVEIDAEATQQAKANFEASPWSDRLTAYCADIQRFTMANHTEIQSLGGEYDLVVSNPPYFTNSLVPPDARRAAARHTATLPYPALARCAADLLTAQGRFAVIVPTDQAAELIAAAKAEELYLYNRLDIHPVPGRSARRSLLAFSRFAGVADVAALTIQTAPQTYTAEYIELTKDFYLFF